MSGGKRRRVEAATGKGKGKSKHDIKEKMKAKGKSMKARKGAAPNQVNIMAVGKQHSLAAPMAHQITETLKSRRARRKLEMAEYCEKIVEDPEHCVYSNQGAKKDYLKELHLMCSDEDPYVRKLAMVSELTVLQDILPDYKIRLPTAGELKVKVKKDTKKQWDYEAALLHGYQRYLQTLEGHLQFVTETQEDEEEDDVRALHRSVGLTALKCLTQLLESRPDFNFRSNIVGALVPLLSRSLDKEVQEQVADAVKRVFSSDHVGIVSLDVVKLVASIAKKRGVKTNPALLDLLLSLRLHTSLDEESEIRAEQRKERKLKKDDVAKGFRVADADTTKQLRRNQLAMLKEVLYVYLRLLRSSGNHRILPAALRGVAHFAHLIDYQIVGDLVDSLEDICHDEEDEEHEEGESESEDEEEPSPAMAPVTTANRKKRKHSAITPARVGHVPVFSASVVGIRLQCALTGLRILSGPGRELNRDDGVFAGIIYRTIPSMLGAESHVGLACDTLEALVLKRRQLSMDVVAAFVKRISSVALHLQLPNALALMSIVRRAVIQYGGVREILDSEADRALREPFKAYTTDPTKAGALSSSLWELVALQRHWHPAAQVYGKKLQDTSCILLGNFSHHQLLKEYDLSTGGFNPPPPMTMPKRKGK